MTDTKIETLLNDMGYYEFFLRNTAVEFLMYTFSNIF